MTCAAFRALVFGRIVAASRATQAAAIWHRNHCARCDRWVAEGAAAAKARNPAAALVAEAEGLAARVDFERNQHADAESN